MGRKTQKAAKREHEATKPARRLRDRAPVRYLAPLAKLADQQPMALLGGGTLALGMVTRRPAMIRSGARMLAAQIVAIGAKSLAKGNVDRLRPDADGAPGLTKGSGTDDKSRNAFPSGHTAGAVASAEAVAHEVPAAATTARGLAALAGALQVPRGKHYVSDVVAGAAVGWLSERIAGAAMRAIERLAEDRTLSVDAEGEAEAHPS